MAFLSPLFLATIFVLGAVYRLSFLTEPFRCDEAYTYLNYASKSLKTIVSTYTFPNNHIFHSILVHFTTRAFGFTPLGLRLPVFVAGLLLIGLGAMMALKFTDDWRSAWLTAFFLAVSPIMVFYSVNARGYMLQALLSTLAIVLYAFPAIRLRPVWFIVTLSGCLWLVIYTVPTGTTFVCPFILYLILVSGRDGPFGRRTIYGVAALTAVLVCCGAIPIARELLNVAHGNSHGTSASHSLALLDAGTSLAHGILPEGLFLLAAFYGYYRLPPSVLKPRLLVLCLAGWCAMNVLPINSLAPTFGRCYLPLFPVAMALAAHGVVSFGDLLYRRGRRSSIVLVFLIGIFGGSLLWNVSVIFRDRAKLYFPERQTAVAIRELTLKITPLLQARDRVQGTDFTSDATAAAYTVSAVGFHGFYGIRNLYKVPVETIYLLGQNQRSVAAFYRERLDPRLWAIPEFIASAGSGIAFATHRQAKNRPLPNPIYGYSD